MSDNIPIYPKDSYPYWTYKLESESDNPRTNESSASDRHLDDVFPYTHRGNLEPDF